MGEKEEKKNKNEKILKFSLRFYAGHAKKSSTESPQTIEDFPLISFPEIFFSHLMHTEKKKRKIGSRGMKKSVHILYEDFSIFTFFHITKAANKKTS